MESLLAGSREAGRGRERRAGHAGYEPRRLFNVVQFVMSAPGGRATVTLEDAMQIMYLRYGRQLLDSQVRAACRATAVH